MIRLYTATPGSGKTCLVMEHLIKEVDRQFYKEFYTNIEGIKIMGMKPLPLTLIGELLTLKKTLSNHPNSLSLMKPNILKHL